MERQSRCVDCGKPFSVVNALGRLPSRCEPCKEHHERLRNSTRQARYRAAHPEETRRRASENYWRRRNQPGHLEGKRDRALRKYGITRVEFKALLAAQGGNCAICHGGPNGKGDFHVDHCHKSKVVRGILCHKCNTMLGLANDDPARLLAAAEYLNR